jgi:hypothetical protein
MACRGEVRGGTSWGADQEGEGVVIGDMEALIGNMEVKLRGGWNASPSFRIHFQEVGSSHMGSCFLSKTEPGPLEMDFERRLSACSILL